MGEKILHSLLLNNRKTFEPDILCYRTSERSERCPHNVADMRSPDEGLPAGLTAVRLADQGRDRGRVWAEQGTLCPTRAAYPELSDVARASRY